MAANDASVAQSCPSEELLADFVAGTASDAERDELEHHIDACERCAAVLAFYGDAFVTATGKDVGEERAPGQIRMNGFAGRYEIRECVGFGSGGTVYKAYDPELDRVVALKVLQTGDGGSTQPEQRWTREAKVMAKVVHPNVVAVHDVGLADDCVFIAAEFVEGGSLDQWLDREPRTWTQILKIFDDAGRGLAAIHERGLVHRDFKPHNVMVGGDGRARVTDFGLARILPDLASEAETDVTAELELSPGQMAATIASRTRTGTIVGTPSYMSPEQWRGRVADERSDQFSFCVALYEALYGRRPFDARTAVELADQVCTGEPKPPPANTSVPRWVAPILVRGMSRDSDDRYESMNALLVALSETPRRRRMRWTVAAVAVGFVGVGLGSYALAGLSTPTEPSCQTQADRIDEVWTDDAKAEVAAALDTVPAVARDVEQTIDAWTDDWKATSVKVCEASRADDHASPRQYQLQVGCLDRRLTELRAAAGVLWGLDDDMALRAMNVIDKLSAPERCEDFDQLETIEPTYGSPEARALALAMAEDLDRVDALRLAGQHDAALELARKLVAQADEDGDPAVRASALIELGETLTAAKLGTEAEKVLRDAVWAAEASGHVVAATAGWIELVHVVGGQLERYEDAEEAAQRAAAAVHRLGDSEQKIALASNRAVVASMRGDYEEALRQHRAVFEQAVELLGPDHRQIARMHANLAAVLAHLGRIDEAVEHAETALKVQRARFPGKHPVAVELLNTLGATRVHQGRLDGARAALEEALEEAESTLPPSNITIASVLSNLAQVEFLEGKPEAAAERYDRVLSIYRAAHGPKHPDVALALHNYAGALDEAGDPEQAVALYRESLAMRIELMGAEHPATAGTMHNLGLTLSDGENLDEGIDYLQRALQIRLKADIDPYYRATTSFMLARAYAKRGDDAEALEAAKQARDFLQQIAPRKKDILEHVEAWIATRDSE